MPVPFADTGNSLSGGDQLGFGSASTIPAAMSDTSKASFSQGDSAEVSSSDSHSRPSHLSASSSLPRSRLQVDTLLHCDSSAKLNFGSSSNELSSSSCSQPSPKQPPSASTTIPRSLSSSSLGSLRLLHSNRRPSWLRRPTLHVDARSQDSELDIMHDNIAMMSAPRQNLQGRLQDRLIVGVFGLPARGKTFISTKVGRYLNWVGIRTRVFSCTAYRRAEFGPYQDPEFFDYNNAHRVAMRRDASSRCLHDMFEFFYRGGQLAVLNAHNVTQKERDLVTEYIALHQDRVECSVLWVESICDDPAIVERNILAIERHVTEFLGKSLEQVAEDYRERIRHYELAYEPLTDPDSSFIRYFSAQHKVIGNQIKGYVQGKIMSFLSNLRMIRYPLLISRHGESIANTQGHLGGDSDLTELGNEYGQALGQFVADRKHSLSRLKVWSSTLKRAVQTAAYCECVERTQWPALREIEAGRFEGMTYAAIRDQHSEEYEARAADKLRYRYPNGESYLDVMRRLEPIVYELERADSPVLLVSHKALLRCLCGYFFGTCLSEIPSLEFPPHTVLELKPHPYGFDATRYELGVAHAELDDTVETGTV